MSSASGDGAQAVWLQSMQLTILFPVAIWKKLKLTSISISDFKN